MSIRRLLPRVALAVLLSAAVAWAALQRNQINLALLDAWLRSLGLWAPAGYVALYAVGTVAFVPGTVFALAGGALFGPLWGSILISQVPRSAPRSPFWSHAPSRETGSRARPADS